MTRTGLQGNVRHAFLALSLLAAALGPAGCGTPAPATAPQPAADAKKGPESSLMAKARVERDAGKYSEAMLSLAQQARLNPDEPGLEALRTSILDRMLTHREQELKPALPLHEKQMDQEVDGEKKVPDSYGARRVIEPAPAPIRLPKNPAEAMLQLPVTLTLEGADLTAFIMGLSQSAGPGKKINMIADDALGGGQTMSISVTNVPLREVLDFAARNLDVSFYVGESMLWVTKRTDATDSVPMQTRLYKLRKGIASIEKAGDDGAGISLIAAIDKFVPKTTGADLMFDKDSHVLIAKNTRDNLRLIEDLIEVLDVVPPQVLIEARFISTGVSDLRELGVNWETSDLYFRSSSHANPQAILKGGKIMQPGNVVTPALDASVAYYGLLNDAMFNVVIQALEKSGKSRTLSVPRVTTLNNQPARIRVGEDFLYFDNFVLQEVANGQNENGQNQYVSQLVPEGEPTKEELGIMLEVTPSVGADRQTVSLTLKPEISEFVRWEYYNVANDQNNENNDENNNNNNNNNNENEPNAGLSVLKLPIFRRSEVETKVAVHSGETVAMGGLITATEGKEQTRVPILGSIPFLGALFRHDVKSNDQKNLLIFVTARILAETGEELVPLYIPEPGSAPK